MQKKKKCSICLQDVKSLDHIGMMCRCAQGQSRVMCLACCTQWFAAHPDKKVECLYCKSASPTLLHQSLYNHVGSKEAKETTLQSLIEIETAPDPNAVLRSPEWQDLKLDACPTCSQVYEKDGGCNMMLCRRCLSWFVWGESRLHWSERNNSFRIKWHHHVIAWVFIMMTNIGISGYHFWTWLGATFLLTLLMWILSRYTPHATRWLHKQLWHIISTRPWVVKNMALYICELLIASFLVVLGVGIWYFDVTDDVAVTSPSGARETLRRSIVISIQPLSWISGGILVCYILSGICYLWNMLPAKIRFVVAVSSWTVAFAIWIYSLPMHKTLIPWCNRMIAVLEEAPERFKGPGTIGV